MVLEAGTVGVLLEARDKGTGAGLLGCWMCSLLIWELVLLVCSLREVSWSSSLMISHFYLGFFKRQ